MRHEQVAGYQTRLLLNPACEFVRGSRHDCLEGTTKIRGICKRGTSSFIRKHNIAVGVRDRKRIDVVDIVYGPTVSWVAVVASLYADGDLRVRHSCHELPGSPNVV
jgi:hypothetical protein